MHKTLFLVATTSCLFVGGQPETTYKRKIPSLKAYAAIKVAELQLPKETLEKALPFLSQLWVTAGCEVITNSYRWQHCDPLKVIDCPDMAHFVILHHKMSPNAMLENAERNHLTITVRELRDRGAQYTTPVLRDYAQPHHALVGNGELA